MTVIMLFTVELTSCATEVQLILYLKLIFTSKTQHQSLFTRSMTRCTRTEQGKPNNHFAQ
jgi:hypothetical protein